MPAFAIGDPQTSAERFFAVLDAHGLLVEVLAGRTPRVQ